MKNLWKSESAVAYLLLVGIGLTIVVTGITYSVVSDFVDYILVSINGYSGTPLANNLSTDSIETGNLLLMAFKFSLMPSLIAIIYFGLSMALKPNKEW